MLNKCLITIVLLAIHLSFANESFRVSVEMIRDYTITTDEYPIENTLLIEKDFSDFTIGAEAIFIGSASTTAENNDEFNFTIGYGVNDFLSTAFIQRVLLTNDKSLEANGAGGALISLTYKSLATITDDNECIIDYSYGHWQYINTFLIEKSLSDVGILSTSLGIENELTFTHESPAVNATHVFTTIGYKTFSISLGYILETLPETMHTIEFGITLKL